MRTAALLVIAALAAPLATACTRESSRPPSIAKDEAAQLLARRVWLDHEPKGHDDRFHILVFDGKNRAGLYQDRTIWKGAFELFRYEAEAGRLTFKLPASKKEVKTGFRIERVRRGEADVHLILDQAADGPTEYWGYRFDRAVETTADADAWLQATFPAE